MNEGSVKQTLPQALPLGQGLFYLTSGIWPLIDMPSFEAVTGRKTDKWLVKTVGLLVAVSGSALIVLRKKSSQARKSDCNCKRSKPGGHRFCLCGKAPHISGLPT